ncbi:MAG: hypothetical protein K9J21_09845, partial [Bacteroidales bacterium]|nr:hypothetical protein [Bacteroidales bacterium]
FAKTQDIPLLSFSKTKLRGTVCGKSARTGLWGSGKVTSRSTRTLIREISGQTTNKEHGTKF